MVLNKNIHDHFSTYDDIIGTPEYHVKIHHSAELFIYFSGPEFSQNFLVFPWLFFFWK